MKAQYYNFYPRNFGNEYFTIKVENEEQLNEMKRFDESLDYTSQRLERVSLKDLRVEWRTEKDRRKYDAAFSGYCQPNDPLPFTKFALDYCPTFFSKFLFD